MLSDAAQVIAILSSTVADFDETNELVSRFFFFRSLTWSMFLTVVSVICA